MVKEFTSFLQTCGDNLCKKHMKASQCYFTCVDIIKNKISGLIKSVMLNEMNSNRRYMSLIVIELKNQN